MVAPLKLGDRWLRIDGRTVHLRCGGGGVPLVLVHGLGGPLMWQRVETSLASGFHVIVVDLAGFGFSEAPRHRMSTEDYADLLAGILDGLTLKSAVIAGISYGGQVAVTLAQRHPHRVIALVLIGSTGLQTVGPLSEHRRLFRGILWIGRWSLLHSPALICYAGRRSFHRVASRPEDLCMDFYRQLSGKGNRSAWCNALFRVFTERSVMLRITGEVHQPVVLIWGRNDRTVPVKYAYEFSRLLGGPPLVFIDHCAHSVPLEQPERLMEIIRLFAAGSGRHVTGMIPNTEKSHESKIT